MGPENTYINSVHKHLPPELYRMKNHNQYNGGIADVWYSGKRDLWVEYKFIVVPKRPDTLIDLVSGKKPEISYLQQEWLRDRHLEGRNVNVIVGCKEGGVRFAPMEWEEPMSAEDFRFRVIDRKTMANVITRLTE